MALLVPKRFGVIVALALSGTALSSPVVSQVPSVGPGVCVSSPAACNAAFPRPSAPRSSGGNRGGYSGGGYSNDAMMMNLMGSAMNSFINGMMQGMEAAEQQRTANAFAHNDEGIRLYNDGNISAAISSFSQAAQLAPTDPNIRANTVLDALAAQGLAPDKATIEAFGESRPLVDTADGVREPQNRRVEVTVR